MRRTTYGSDPTNPYDFGEDVETGLTKREYFAAHAPVVWKQSRTMNEEASLAVQWADALIEELNK